MGLLKGQLYAAPQRALPTNNKESISEVIDITNETVQLYYWSSGVRTIDAGEAAATIVEGKLRYDNIKNSSGSMEGNSGDTSLSFTCAALTTEVAFDVETFEVTDQHTGLSRATDITADLSNGEYMVDYSTGMIYGKKKTTAATCTATTYKIKVPIARKATDVGFKKIVEEASATVTYVGTAYQGTATSAAKWLIQKIDTTSGTIITWAGKAQFDQEWDNRASLSYS